MYLLPFFSTSGTDFGQKLTYTNIYNICDDPLGGLYICFKISKCITMCVWACIRITFEGFFDIRLIKFQQKFKNMCNALYHYLGHMDSNNGAWAKNQMGGSSPVFAFHVFGKENCTMTKTQTRQRQIRCLPSFWEKNLSTTNAQMITKE